MITAVDTNILIDILEPDPVFGSKSKAAEYWAKYRSAGGKRDRIAADFLIGDHAFVNANRLLTRDRGFNQNLFLGLKVIYPELPTKTHS